MNNHFILEINSIIGDWQIQESEQAIACVVVACAKDDFVSLFSFIVAKVKA